MMIFQPMRCRQNSKAYNCSTTRREFPALSIRVASAGKVAKAISGLASSDWFVLGGCLFVAEPINNSNVHNKQRGMANKNLFIYTYFFAIYNYICEISMPRQAIMEG